VKTYLAMSHCLKPSTSCPYLDPFILREHLRRRGFKIASSYFGISEADRARMVTMSALKFID